MKAFAWAVFGIVVWYLITCLVFLTLPADSI
jgi:hypothetical protein